MKKFIALLLVLTILLPTLVFADVAIGERPIDRVPRITIDGTVYVPLRITAEAHGAYVVWDAKNAVVIVHCADDSEFIIDINVTGGFNQDGTIYVPYIFANETFSRPVGPVADGAATQEAVPAGNANIHGLISRVYYGENVAYIFGSMHASRAHWFPLADVVEDAMSRADVFVFEIDLTAMADPDVSAYSQKLMFLPDGTVLSDVVPEDVLAQFEQTLATYGGMQLALLETMTPYAAMSLIQMMFVMPLVDLDVETSVDSYVQMHAMSVGAPILGLNDVLYELRLAFDIPMDIQIEGMRYFMDLDSAVASMLLLAQAYEDQDIDALRAMFHEDIQEGEYGNYFLDIILHHRDRIFAEEIARLLQETEEPTTFFVTVGIGHLLGDGIGLVFYFLEEMGFDVVGLYE